MANFNNFASIAANLVPALEQVVSDVADMAVSNIQANIQANGQVRTGDMLNAIAVEDGPDSLTKMVIAGMDYSIYQELGTWKMAGRPFFYPGVEQTRPYFQSRLDAVVRSF
jgi:hypothetical protein